ncbi:MAG TPA: hypothetical protein VFC19_27075 [Candidatus Limnocylindrales bacterium]|nr:hypothetical protein [Candidatus Limnocylindrales bacterium]
MQSEGPDRLGRAGTWMLAAAASLAAGTVTMGVVAGAALETTLADTYNVDVAWHDGQRFALVLNVAATFVLALLTVVVMLATRRVSVRRGRVIAGVLAAALVFACALPSAGWFWLIFQDGFPSDREFKMDAYGHWYYPLVGVFGAGYVLVTAGAALLLLLPRPATSAGRGDRPLG